MTRHELALLRVSALTGLVMFGGMSSLFYTQMTGILSVSTDHIVLTCANSFLRRGLLTFLMLMCLI